jgi:hypothetical protein
MPFSRDYYFKRFKPAELEQLQAAYLKTCEVLGRCPITSPQKDEMSREIIQIYECGISSPEKIAELIRLRALSQSLMRNSSFRRTSIFQRSVPETVRKNYKRKNTEIIFTPARLSIS